MGKGDSSSAAAVGVKCVDGGDLNASLPADGEADKLSGEEAGKRDLGAISKTGKR
jgi:hypothetical protein